MFAVIFVSLFFVFAGTVVDAVYSAKDLDEFQAIRKSSRFDNLLECSISLKIVGACLALCAGLMALGAQFSNIWLNVLLIVVPAILVGVGASILLVKWLEKSRLKAGLCRSEIDAEVSTEASSPEVTRQDQDEGVPKSS